MTKFIGNVVPGQRFSCGSLEAIGRAPLSARQLSALERIAEREPAAKVVGSTEMWGEPILCLRNGRTAVIRSNGFVDTNFPDPLALTRQHKGAHHGFSRDG